MTTSLIFREVEFALQLVGGVHGGGELLQNVGHGGLLLRLQIC